MKPVCLFFFANDIEVVGQNLRSLAIEARGIDEAMKSALPMCEYKIVKNTSPDDFRRTLAEYRHRVAIVHYAGHAESLQLMLETETGGKEGLRNETLAAYLSHQDNLQLVFLNGCATGDQVDALLENGIPYVISTTRKVKDTNATKLSTAFYEGLAAGSTINECWLDAVAATRQQNKSTCSTSQESESITPQTRGGFFEDEVADNDGENPAKNADDDSFRWTLQSRPGLDQAPDWNLPDASENPLLGLPKLPSELGYPEEPFQQLRRFTREEARVFFGRGKEVRALYRKVTSPHEPSVTLLYGQSGVGKSSLLDAGLLPRLECDHQVIYLRRSQDGIVRDIEKALGSSNTASRNWLKQCWQAKESAGKPLVLVLDQLEEACTHSDDEQAEKELAELAKLLSDTFQTNDRPRGKVILVFRKEWFTEVNESMRQHKVSRTDVALKRLDRKSVKAAITLDDAARAHYNLVVDQEVAEQVTAELSADSQSPLAPTLQILLANMWQEARKISRSQPEFSKTLYQSLMGQGIQLGDFLDTQMAMVASLNPEAAKNGLLLSVLRFHCNEQGTAAVRSFWERSDHFGENISKVNKLIRDCQEQFLIVGVASDQDSSDDDSRLAHDTLASVVLDRFHRSNQKAQHAERILKLRTQVADGEETDHLTRTEIRSLKKAKPWMRKFSEVEQTLVNSSEALLRKEDSRRLIVLAISVLVACCFAWWTWTALNTADVNRKVDLLASAAPSTVVAKTEYFTESPSLSWRAVDALSIDSGPPSQSVLRNHDLQINLCLVKCLLGDSNADQVIDLLEFADPEDLISFARVLERSTANYLAPLRTLIAKQDIDEDNVEETVWESRIQMRAKLTWLALLLNKETLLDPDWFAAQAQAESRSRLIKSIAGWFVDEPEFITAFASASDINLRAALCQSVFFLTPSQLDERLRDQMIEELSKSYEHDRLAVRSSARAALNRLGALGEVQRQSKKRNGKDWFSLAYLDDRQQLALLDFALVEEEDGGTFWLTTTEVPWAIVEQNLSQDRLEDRKDNQPPKFVEGGPAQHLLWSDTLDCCNRLTRRHLSGEKDSYSEKPGKASGPPSTIWSIQNENGFRLPLAKEWRIAAAANSKDDYSFGNRFQLLQHFAWTRETADGRVHKIASLLPNANGFFDMHGNVQEWCWPAKPPSGLEPLTEQRDIDQVQTVDGSYFEARDESKLTHAGDPLSGTRRERFLGFRLAISQNPFSDNSTTKRN